MIPENIAGLADFISTLKNIERVEILPFHKMGEYKWEELGYEYKLKETPSPTSEQVEKALGIFRDKGIMAL